MEFLKGVRQSSIDENTLYYLLATCGNDSLVKLWQISVSKGEDESNEQEDTGEQLEDDGEPMEQSGTSSGLGVARGAVYKEKRALTGHGGNVMSVRFSPVHGEILGSVATDRTARIWSVVSL